MMISAFITYIIAIFPAGTLFPTSSLIGSKQSNYQFTSGK